MASTWSVIRVLLLSENSFQMLPSLIASNDIENSSVRTISPCNPNESGHSGILYQDINIRHLFPFHRK